MGLARLIHNRDVQYTAHDTTTGQSQSWVVVDGLSPSWDNGEYRGGMAIPGAWRASLLLADLLASVPWHAYRERAGRPPERLDPTPPLLEQPQPPDPRVTTFGSMALDLIWHGNAIAVVATRNRDGWPTSLVPVPAEYVHVRHANEADAYDVQVPVGAIVYRIGTRTYSPHEVVHVKGPCRPGALRGMGVLENHLAGTLTLASDQARQAGAASGEGIPTGVLKVEDTPEEPLEQDEADEVKASWMRSQATRTVAVLNARTSFLPLAWNPTDAQLLESRRFSLHEIALIFGLDPPWLGVSGDSMTYQNTEQKGTDLVRYSLNGHLARFEQTLSLHLPRGTWAQANLDALLRGTTTERYAAHESALRAGWITPDEVRAREDLPPLTPAQRALLAPRPPAAPVPTTGPKEGATDE
jgi:HK97 family phage portal protein